MVGSLEKACSEFRQKMKENDTDTAQQEQRTVTRTPPFPSVPLPNPTNTTGTREAKRSQGFPRLTQYKAGARLSITSSSGKARLLGCFYIHLLSCCFLISEMPFYDVFVPYTRPHALWPWGPSSAFTTYFWQKLT